MAYKDEPPAKQLTWAPDDKVYKHLLASDMATDPKAQCKGHLPIEITQCTDVLWCQWPIPITIA